MEIYQKTSLTLFYAAVIGALVTIALGIAMGPKAIALAACIGIVLCLTDLWRRKKARAALLLPMIMLGANLLFLVIAGMLAFFFLSPLPEVSLQMPKLSQNVSELNGAFRLRLPEGWSVEPLHAANEIGFRAHPVERTAYMGVAELTVRVRVLEKKQVASTEFFEKMAQTLGLTTGQKKRLFNFHTEPAQLLNESGGLWSYLVLKRFWIPLYQTSLFGLQKGRYLCSVATSGLKSHDKLATVLCLGVMESIQIAENAEKFL